MGFKVLPVFVAILACALWPQGVVLCMGVEGHVEVELEGAGCCPSESDDCLDCEDFGSPNQRAARSRVSLSPPLLSATGLPAEKLPAVIAAETAVPLLPPRPCPLDTVRLLV